MPPGAAPGTPESSGDAGPAAHAWSHYMRGLLLEGEHGRTTDEALRQFEEAARLDPSNHALSARVATAYLVKGGSETAIRILEESCRRSPDKFTARLDLATAYQISGKLEQARVNYREALDLDPSKTPLYATLANLLFFMGRDREALDILVAGIRRSDDPKQLTGFAVSRALLFLDADEPQRAVAALRPLADALPSQRSQILCAVGEILERNSDKPAALKAYRAATRAPSPVAAGFIRLAVEAFSADDVKGALRIIRRGEALHPEDPVVLFTLAQVLAGDEQHAEAIKVFERLDKVEGKTKDSDFTLPFFLLYGASCEQVGQIQKATAVFERGIAAYPDSHEILNYLAYMWAEQGLRLDEALAHVNRALKLSPDNGAYVDTKAWILHKQGHHKEALELITRATVLIPDDPTITDHAGDICSALGMTADAIRWWTLSYQLDSAAGKKPDAVAAKLRASGVDPKSIPPLPPPPPPAAKQE